MIIKMIATFPDGSKMIRTRDYTRDIHRGLKRQGMRPALIQVFGDYFEDQEIIAIRLGLRSTVHPVHGQVTVNGQHLYALSHRLDGPRGSEV